ncbi:MAG: HlyU family transcriptional regulator [Pseudomonadota bacterium]
MSLLSKLFGGGGAAQSEPTTETYQGFTITPEPQRDGTNWRIAAKIEKEGMTHTLIRADQLSDRAECEKFSIAKAKQVIDEQGDRLFG